MTTAADETWVWVDGRCTAAAEARIGALDHGVTVGDGVFETTEVTDAGPIAMSRHLARLRRSAAVLGLEVGTSDDGLRAACDEVMAAARSAGVIPGRLRITVTGGPGPLGSGRDEVPATVIVATAPAGAWPATTEVITVDWARNEHSPITGAKTTSYAENVVAVTRAHAAGASEALFANTAGELCEGTGTNVFVVLDGVLRTPPLASGCLAGITRDLVTGVVSVEESPGLTLADLHRASEVFLTSSTRRVHPVAAVNGQALPQPLPGPRTAEAAAALDGLLGTNPDP